jgi:hypothetical protein
MASDCTPGQAAVAAKDGAPRPGTRVWMVRDGRFGRVVATAQGGLICRVRPDGGGPAVECLGDDLFYLDDSRPG